MKAAIADEVEQEESSFKDSQRIDSFCVKEEKKEKRKEKNTCAAFLHIQTWKAPKS